MHEFRFFCTTMNPSQVEAASAAPLAAPASCASAIPSVHTHARVPVPIQHVAINIRYETHIQYVVRTTVRIVGYGNFFGSAPVQSGCRHRHVYCSATLAVWPVELEAELACPSPRGSGSSAHCGSHWLTWKLSADAFHGVRCPLPEPTSQRGHPFG